jgi:protein-tyrosine phosphatase
LPSGRTYVSVSPAEGGSAVVAAERMLPFQGAENFRDLGGYRASGGRRVKWGQIFRSDALHALTPTDLTLCEALGFRTVYDLRREHERTRAPNVLPASVHTVVLPIGNDDVSAEGLMQRIRDGETSEALLIDVYYDLVDTAADTFAELLTQLVDPGSEPALFHCAAGKDRTGIAAALLLTVLGVSEEDVLSDYELTPPYRNADRADDLQALLTRYSLAPEVFAGLFGAPRQAMRAALDRIRDTHGGVQRYLTERGGMEPRVIDDLRGLLLA